MLEGRPSTPRSTGSASGSGSAPRTISSRIGTGWGAFAIRAAERFGRKVTTTTISRQQHDFARERTERAGLSDRIELVLEDYRDLRGTFSKAVSVEMVEAVGARHYPSYFSNIGRLLEPGGAFACQAITIHDRHFERARRAVDFIQRHIFPGGCIPSVSALHGRGPRGQRHAARASRGHR